MATTLVVVELLIIGFQVLALIALLLLKVDPSLASYASPAKLHEWLENWTPVLKEWVPLLALWTLAGAYTLGLVFDKLLGLLGWGITAGLRRLLPKMLRDLIAPHDPSDSIERLKLRYAHLEGRVENFLRHIRLLRATFWSTLLASVLVGWAFPSHLWGVSLGLFLISFLTCAAWLYTKNAASRGWPMIVNAADKEINESAM
jgi:hypothetical protein